MLDFDIIILLAIVGFIGWKLFGALGTRTGHENPNPDPMARRRHGAPASDQSADNVVNMPNANRDAAPGSASGQGILDIQLADRSFDPGGFLEGARHAYEMIVTAFAEGNRRSLRPLLSDEAYEDFDAALRAREAEGKRIETTFIGIDDAKISSAALNGTWAEVVVKFISEIISVTKNEDGAVIEGDPTTVRKITDVWTFSRDTRSPDPNWVLIATDEA